MSKSDLSQNPDLTSYHKIVSPMIRRGFAILSRLARGEATVMDLAAPIVMAQPAVSQHLKGLEKAGRILRRVDGARRPCRLAPQGLTGNDP